MNARVRSAATFTMAACLVVLSGCPDQFPEELNIEVNKTEEIIVDAPADFDGADFVLVTDATVIPDVAVIPVEVVPDVTVLTFENFTDFDLVISYYIEGYPETVLVPLDTTVSVEYDPCLADVQLDYEDDFDPVTGLYLGSYDLIDVVLVEGVDYFCGDEIFFTFDPDAVFVTAQAL